MWMLGWLACSLGGEAEPLVVPADDGARTNAMRNHQVAVHRARDAVIAQDLDGVHRAGASLAVKREIPRLPPPAIVMLERVRQGGAELAVSSNLDEAADQLVELTATCARCHTMFEVPAKVPLQATQRDLLWTALVFRSEAHWKQATSKDPSLHELEYWEDRRLALLIRLQGGTF
ncbi:MAG: hypothetical protein AAGA48_08010 [Myxococcota bacterium]